jgi:hypothetical protein
MAKGLELTYVKGLWYSGHKFISCWDMNSRKDAIKKNMASAKLGTVIGKDGQAITRSSVIETIIHSPDIPNYCIVVLKPEMISTYQADKMDKTEYIIHSKATQLMEIFKLAPVKHRMTSPKPFSDYRYTKVDVVEDWKEVQRMVQLGSLA